MADCVVGGDGVPAEVLDGDAGLSGFGWLEGDMQLGAEIGREAAWRQESTRRREGVQVLMTPITKAVPSS
jgi:hypothetical protein